MRIMALDAVAHCRGVNFSFDIRSLLIGVTGDTEGNRRGGNELYSGDVFFDPDLVATGTAHGNCRMDRLAFRFVLMALRASCRILLGVKGDRMYCCPGQ
jgi:hypothetical protein